MMICQNGMPAAREVQSLIGSELSHHAELGLALHQLLFQVLVVTNLGGDQPSPVKVIFRVKGHFGLVEEGLEDLSDVSHQSGNVGLPFGLDNFFVQFNNLGQEIGVEANLFTLVEGTPSKVEQVVSSPDWFLQDIVGLVHDWGPDVAQCLSKEIRSSKLRRGKVT